MLHTSEVRSNSIQKGDLVIVYERHDSMKAARVDPAREFANKFGVFKMSGWVGLPFGCRVTAKAPSKGWVFLLRPNPELWTKVLLHRTQILYAADISLTCLMLELQPGMTVLECGTGSGSLTHALARAVAPSGQVHTFEYHAPRAQAAEKEFVENDISSMVSVQERDIQASGFPEALHGCADALFLDVPGPWQVAESAAACLRPNGCLASFSPCIEQVQRMRGALASVGFWDVHVFEGLLREYEVRSRPVPDLSSKQGGETQTPTEKMLQGPADPVAARAQQSHTHSPQAGSVTSRLSRCTGSSKRKREHPGAQSAANSIVPPASEVLAKPTMEARGHTGYLLFARAPTDELATDEAAAVALPGAEDGDGQDDYAQS